MKIIILCFVLLLLDITSVLSQDSQAQRDSSLISSDTLLVVGNIIVVGNSSTKDFVILREMSLQPNSQITQELLHYDQERIYSLGLFNRVKLNLIPTSSGKADIIVEVSERWYIFPFPVFGIKDRDWKKFYYGAGILHSNFRGRNEKLFATFILSYDPSVVLSYRNPFISDDGSNMLDARFSYNKIRNKSVAASEGGNNFDEQHFSFLLSVGKRIGIKHTFWLSAGYEVVNVSEYQPGRTISKDGKDKFLIVGFSYLYDTRDLYEYPSYGTLIKFSMTKYGFPADKVDIIRYGGDLRRYIPLFSKFVLTGRAFTDIAAAGPTPSYHRIYFGYGERIRGHFRKVMEGENIFGVSAELHYPLLAPMYINLDFLPPEFSVLKFGVVAAAFGDAGTVWFRREPFAMNSFVKGYGFGIHFLLPYSWVLRTDFAWNEYRRSEFILDLGSSF